MIKHIYTVAQKKTQRNVNQYTRST